MQAIPLVIAAKEQPIRITDQEVPGKRQVALEGGEAGASREIGPQIGITVQQGEQPPAWLDWPFGVNRHFGRFVSANITPKAGRMADKDRRWAAL